MLAGRDFRGFMVFTVCIVWALSWLTCFELEHAGQSVFFLQFFRFEVLAFRTFGIWSVG